MWRVANSSKLVECCKCSSLNLLGLWRFSIPAVLWWEQTWRPGASTSWKALTTRVGRAFWEMLSLRVVVAVGIPAKSPLPRLTSNYSNPACVGVLCAGRICSACPRYTVTKSLKSHKKRQLQFHLWGVCQTIFWETVSRGMSQHSRLLFVNDPFCQDPVLELCSKRRWRLITIHITNPTSVEVD